MATKNRLEQIDALVAERGFISVDELSQLCQVSKMTIRRDLDSLEKDGRIRRIFGGAASLTVTPPAVPESDSSLAQLKPEPVLGDRIDVLIATSVNPNYDGRLLESLTKREIPIIAESLAIQDEESVVAVDNYQGGFDLGSWAGSYATQKWGGQAHILDLSFSLANTQARSRGFLEGVRAVIPDAELVLSINSQSRYATAYQFTRDALAVHKDINIIFAINDTTAWGAITACRDLHLSPDHIIVMAFGLEGDTLKNALMEGTFCKAGLAMFPELVGPTCVEAAISAFNHQPLPLNIVTPYVIVTPSTLPDYYMPRAGHWEINWEPVRSRLPIPIYIRGGVRPLAKLLPRRIGFIIPFSEHDWYKNLIISMLEYASALKIDFEVIDAEQNLKDEIDLRRRAIAREAAREVKAGEVILMDGGPICNYMAEALLDRQDITIITNSIPIFDILKQHPGLTLILTGGAYRPSSGMLVGPTAEGTLHELRADKLFLMVTGISLSFGLSHTNISEVTMKQATIHSAREVILLADHTYFGQESIVQVAPLTAIHKLITDDALPASTRLELSKLGIQIILANE